MEIKTTIAELMYESFMLKTTLNGVERNGSIAEARMAILDKRVKLTHLDYPDEFGTIPHQDTPMPNKKGKYLLTYVNYEGETIVRDITVA